MMYVCAQCAREQPCIDDAAVTEPLGSEEELPVSDDREPAVNPEVGLPQLSVQEMLEAADRAGLSTVVAGDQWMIEQPIPPRWWEQSSQEDSDGPAGRSDSDGELPRLVAADTDDEGPPPLQPSSPSEPELRHP